MGKRLVAATAFLALLLLAGVASSPAARADAVPQIVIQAGKADSPNHAFAVQFAEAVSLALNGTLTLEVAESQGSVQNVIDAPKRGANYVFTTNPSLIGQARRGEKPFEPDARYKDIRALFAIPFLTMHWVVRADSGIKSFADLAGHSFIPGGRGSFGEGQTSALLKGLGLASQVQLIDVDVTAAPAAVSGKQVSGFALAGAFPVRTILDLARTTPIRLLGLSKDQLAHALANDDTIVEQVIPRGTYPGVDGDVTVVALPAGAYTTRRMSEATAYSITKAFWSQLHALAARNPSWAAVTPATLATLGARLHGGALRYYAEAGIAVPPALK